MNKKELLSLALGTVGLMGLIYDYSNVQAGSLTNSTGGDFPITRVAKELVDAGAVNATIQFRHDNHRYTPSQIPLTSLSDPTISVSVDNGKIYVGEDKIAICRVEDNATIATYRTGSGTNQLGFTETGTTISNGVNYWIGGHNGTHCNRTAQLTFEIPKGASSVTLTIKTGPAATQQVHDTASARIISVVPQFSAEVISRFGAEIDYEADFKKFKDNATSDKATIQLKSASLTTGNHVQEYNGGAYAGTNAIFSVTLKPTDMSGISTVAIKPHGFSSVACAKLTDRFVCNATNTVNQIASAIANKPDSYTINATVTGTEVLSERSFTVDALLDFDSPQIADRTLLSNVDFGRWVYRGTAIYVPIIGHDPAKGRFTTIRLQSKDRTPSANIVRALILASNGELVEVDLGRIIPGQPFTITGEQLQNIVKNRGKPIGDTFAAILIVTTAEENLFGYAVLDHQGVSRRVPLKVRGGQIVE